MNIRIKENRKNGFTLMEVIIVLMVLVVITTVTVPSFAGLINKVKRSKYQIEANSVCSAVEMYILDNYMHGSIDVMEILDKITRYKLNSSKNPLTNYLRINCTKGAYIESLTLGNDDRIVDSIVYVVGGYRIEVGGGDARVTFRSGSGN